MDERNKNKKNNENEGQNYSSIQKEWTNQQKN
jgi:hypothetical protein